MPRIQPLKLIAVIAACLLISACGSAKKNVSLKVQSDPLGAYALMQIKYKGDENTDWRFLGATPVIANKEILTSDATEVSIRVIRPGYYDQTKTWFVKDFLREYADNKQIVWVPRLVKE
ncbi:MAG: hypothetical protein ACI9WC_002020 [Arenicella sp.]|jgi:hypothetical protein